MPVPSRNSTPLALNLKVVDTDVGVLLPEPTGSPAAPNFELSLNRFGRSAISHKLIVITSFAMPQWAINRLNGERGLTAFVDLKTLAAAIGWISPAGNLKP